MGHQLLPAFLEVLQFSSGNFHKPGVLFVRSKLEGSHPTPRSWTLGRSKSSRRAPHFPRDERPKGRIQNPLRKAQVACRLPQDLLSDLLPTAPSSAFQLLPKTYASNSKASQWPGSQRMKARIVLDALISLASLRATSG